MTRAPTCRATPIITVLGALVALAAALSAGPASAAAPAAGPAVAVPVTIQGSAFVPATVSINAGKQVIWTNADSTPHTVTADGGTFNGTVASGQQFTVTFSSAGSYPYHCSIHPFMTGVIIVR